MPTTIFLSPHHKLILTSKTALDNGLAKHTLAKSYGIGKSGLPIIALGKHGGKIVGYNTKGLPIYDTSPLAQKLAESKKPDKKEAAFTTLVKWLSALGVKASPLYKDKQLFVGMSTEDALALSEHFGVPAVSVASGHAAIALKDLKPLIGKPLIPVDHDSIAAEQAAPDLFPKDLSVLEATGKVLGSHNSPEYKDKKTGERYLFKYTNKVIARAEEAASRIGALLIPGQVHEVKYITLNGKFGTLIKMHPEYQPLGKEKSTMDVSADLKARFQKHFDGIVQQHVLDWICSQHDTHGDNIGLVGDKVFGIDKGQAWKFLGQDALPAPGIEASDKCNPNPSKQVYSQFWKLYHEGKITGSPVQAASAVFSRLANVSEDQLKAILLPYVKAAGGSNWETKLQKVLGRVKESKSNWENFLGETIPTSNAASVEGAAKPQKTPIPKKVEAPPMTVVAAEKAPQAPTESAAGGKKAFQPVKVGKTFLLTSPGAGEHLYGPNYPGAGFKADIKYKGKPHKVEFTANGVSVEYPDGTSGLWDSPQEAADSFVIKAKGLDIQLAKDSYQLKKLGIAYSATKLFKTKELADVLAEYGTLEPDLTPPPPKMSLADSWAQHGVGKVDDMSLVPPEMSEVAKKHGSDVYIMDVALDGGPVAPTLATSGYDESGEPLYFYAQIVNDSVTAKMTKDFYVSPSHPLYLPPPKEEEVPQEKLPAPPGVPTGKTDVQIPPGAPSVQKEPLPEGAVIVAKKKFAGMPKKQPVTLKVLSGGKFGVQLPGEDNWASFDSLSAASDYVWVVGKGYEDADDYIQKTGKKKVPSGGGWKFWGVKPGEEPKLDEPPASTAPAASPATSVGKAQALTEYKDALAAGQYGKALDMVQSEDVGTVMPAVSQAFYESVAPGTHIHITDIYGSRYIALKQAKGTFFKLTALTGKGDETYAKNEFDSYTSFAAYMLHDENKNVIVVPPKAEQPGSPSEENFETMPETETAPGTKDDTAASGVPDILAPGYGKAAGLVASINAGIGTEMPPPSEAWYANAAPGTAVSADIKSGYGAGGTEIAIKNEDGTWQFTLVHTEAQYQGVVPEYESKYVSPVLKNNETVTVVFPETEKPLDPFALALKEAELTEQKEKKAAPSPKEAEATAMMDALEIGESLHGPDGSIKKVGPNEYTYKVPYGAVTKSPPEAAKAWILENLVEPDLGSAATPVEAPGYTSPDEEHAAKTTLSDPENDGGSGTATVMVVATNGMASPYSSLSDALENLPNFEVATIQGLSKTKIPGGAIKIKKIYNTDKLYYSDPLYGWKTASAGQLAKVLGDATDKDNPEASVEIQIQEYDAKDSAPVQQMGFGLQMWEEMESAPAAQALGLTDSGKLLKYDFASGTMTDAAGEAGTMTPLKAYEKFKSDASGKMYLAAKPPLLNKPPQEWTSEDVQALPNGIQFTFDKTYISAQKKKFRITKIPPLAGKEGTPTFQVEMKKLGSYTSFGTHTFDDVFKFLKEEADHYPDDWKETQLKNLNFQLAHLPNTTAPLAEQVIKKLPNALPPVDKAQPVKQTLPLLEAFPHLEYVKANPGIFELKASKKAGVYNICVSKDAGLTAEDGIAKIQALLDYHDIKPGWASHPKANKLGAWASIKGEEPHVLHKVTLPAGQANAALIVDDVEKLKGVKLKVPTTEPGSTAVTTETATVKALSHTVTLEELEALPVGTKVKFPTGAILQKEEGGEFDVVVALTGNPPDEKQTLDPATLQMIASKMSGGTLHAPGTTPGKGGPSKDNFETMPEVDAAVKKASKKKKKAQKPAVDPVVAKKKKWAQAHPVAGKGTTDALAHALDDAGYPGHEVYAFEAKGKVYVGDGSPEFSEKVLSTISGKLAAAKEVQSPFGTLVELPESGLYKVAPGAKVTFGPDGKEYPYGTTFEEKKTLKSIRSELEKEGVQLREYKGDEDYDLVLKVPKSDSSVAKLTALKEKYGFKDQPVVQGSYYDLLVVPLTKAELDAPSEKFFDLEVTPKIPPQPPAVQKKALGLSGEASYGKPPANNFADLADLSSVVPKQHGHTIQMGNGALPQNGARVHRLKMPDGKIIHRIDLELPVESTYKLAAAAPSPYTPSGNGAFFMAAPGGEGKWGKFDEATGTWELSSQVTWKSGSTQSSSTALLSDGAKAHVWKQDVHALRRTLVLDVPEDGDAVAAVSEALETLGLDPQTVLREQTDDDVRVQIKAQTVSMHLGNTGRVQVAKMYKAAKQDAKEFEKTLDSIIKSRGLTKAVAESELVSGPNGTSVVRSSMLDKKIGHDKTYQAVVHFQKTHTGLVNFLLQGGASGQSNRFISGNTPSLNIGSATESGEADMNSGGAQGFFTRLISKNTPTTATTATGGATAAIVMHPRALRNNNWHAFKSDSFGQQNSEISESHRVTPKSLTEKDALGTSNEVVFRDIDRQDIAGFVFRNQSERDAFLSQCADNDITELNGVPIKDCAVVQEKPDYYLSGDISAEREKLPLLKKGIE